MKIKFLFVLTGIVLLNEFCFSQQWVSNYNGSGNSDDQVTAMCSDDSGNVYVTGFSVGLNTGYDIVTIKYNFNGVAQWIKRYDGPASQEDRAFGIAQDVNGFIYVGGFATGISNSLEDIVLIKYNPAGIQEWVRTYNGGNGQSDKAFGLAIDNTGADNTGPNIYLTGYTLNNGNYDYRTLKYTYTGNLSWSRNYNGGLNDQSWGIVVDNAGNIGVTGFCEGSNSYDYYTIVYAPDGSTRWARRYNGPASGEDKAMGIVVDNEHNYSVTGFSMGSEINSTFDISTIQYDKNGNIKWTRTYNGAGNLTDRPFGITVDNSNNVIITGLTKNATNNEDVVTISYTKSGVQNWIAIYNNSSNSIDIGYDVSVSSNGNDIYVSGSSTLDGVEKPVMLKYSSTGVLQQSIRYPAAGRSSCVDISALNNLFVSGYSNTQNSENNQYNDFITMVFENGNVILIGISGNNTNIPKEFKLFQNYPNPFNPTTVIKFNVPEASFVEIKLYDIQGRQMQTLVSENMPAGEYQMEFDAKNLPSGVYFYKMNSQNYSKSYSEVKKMVLVK